MPQRDTATREHIARLKSEGWTYREIADELDVSQKTIADALRERGMLEDQQHGSEESEDESTPPAGESNGEGTVQHGRGPQQVPKAQQSAAGSAGKAQREGAQRREAGGSEESDTITCPGCGNSGPLPEGVEVGDKIRCDECGTTGKVTP